MIDLISIRTFIQEYLDRTDIQAEDINESRLLSFVARESERFISEKTTRHVVGLKKLKNNNISIPKGTHKLIEIAYCAKDLIKENDRGNYYDEIKSFTEKTYGDCEIKVEVSCPKCMKKECACDTEFFELKVGQEWAQANLERMYWDIPYYNGVHGITKGGYMQSPYHPSFFVVNPSGHKFFGADYYLGATASIQNKLLGNFPLEYKVERNNIRLNVESGTVLISFLQQYTDEEGFPLIVNDVEVFEALFWSVEAKMLYRDMRKNPNLYNASMSAKQLGEKHMARALEKVNAITYKEWKMLARKYFKKYPYVNNVAHGGRYINDKYDRGLNKLKNR